MTLLVRQALGHAAAHGGDQGVGRTQVNAHGHAAFVRVRRVAGFGDLQECHFFNQVSSRSNRFSISRAKRSMNISALTCATAAG